MQDFAQSRRAGLLELNGVVAVATHRSFRRAATELGLSPSALSHSIATLEQRMGVRLFQRTTRSVSLTEAGERFLARVRPALGQIAEAMDAVNEFRDTPKGTLRINASEGAARHILRPLFLEYLARYPEMRLDLVTEGRFVDIVADGFDAGIRGADAVPADMVSVPCTGPVRFCVVGSPSYFKTRNRPKKPADLLAHNCIRPRYSSGAVYRWQFEKHGQEIEIDVQGNLTLDSYNLMIDAATHGAGLAWLGEWSAEGAIKSGHLVRVLEDWTPPYPGLTLFYPMHRHVSAGLRAFIDLAREVTPKSPRAVQSHKRRKKVIKQAQVATSSVAAKPKGQARK